MLNRRKTSWITRAAFAPLLALPLWVSTPAYAQNDPAAAQALFTDAKRLMSDGQYANACPKLEESQKLDPGIGTKFQLANCYQHLGRTASAWATFLEVAAEAKTAGQGPRERAARERAAALEPVIPKLVVVVPRAAEVTAGLEVKRDGVVMGRGQWGASVPVDPGEHKITAAAPGKKAWETTLSVAATGKLVSVDVPVLESAPVSTPTMTSVAIAPPPALPPPSVVTTDSTAPITSERSGNGQRAFGAVIAVVGVAGLVTGTVFGLQSKSKRDDSSAHCVGNTCDAAGVALRDDAIRNGNYATIGFGVGAAALLGGAILWFTSPTNSVSTSTTTTQTARIQAAPIFGNGTSGLSVRGAF